MQLPEFKILAALSFVNLMVLLLLLELARRILTYAGAPSSGFVVSLVYLGCITPFYCAKNMSDLRANRNPWKVLLPLGGLAGLLSSPVSECLRWFDYVLFEFGVFTRNGGKYVLCSFAESMSGAFTNGLVGALGGLICSSVLLLINRWIYNLAVVEEI